MELALKMIKRYDFNKR